MSKNYDTVCLYLRQAHSLTSNLASGPSRRQRPLKKDAR
jgi:hypothetical protein